MSKPDIKSSEDVQLMVKSFYDRLLADEFLNPIFRHLNLEEHLPRIVAFWEFLLLNKPGFTSNVFDKHLPLNLETVHFDKWLKHFTDTVNFYFEGPTATLANNKATQLCMLFDHKLQEMRK